MNLSSIGSLLGGLGLFLLGMRLMTNGLKQAAGNSLRKILGQWTKTPARGLFSGFLITALVQSSSAVTVAVIGFVNAGLITLSQSIGVIYGSNIGTTVTGWIVAAVGFSVHIKGLALPLIASGAILRLTGPVSRRAHVGDALAGFGLFFLGISTLQGAFQGIESAIDLQYLASTGFFSIPIFLGIGFMLTLLMQSSSAAMALVLTATVSGLATLDQGAAAVIGTNIGTTSTAALSVLGATNNAKKVAAGHIIFNTVTALIALLLLPILLKGILGALSFLGLEKEPALVLAIFHTSFNLLGVFVLWPFTERLVSFLEKRIGKPGSDKARPRYLDSNILGTPELAIDALALELERIGEITRSMARKGLDTGFDYAALHSDKEALDSLIDAARTFCDKMQRTSLPERIVKQVATALRVLQYYRTSGALSYSLAVKGLKPDTEALGDDEGLVTIFMSNSLTVINVIGHPCSAEFCKIDNLLDEMTASYHNLKARLLEAGGQGQMHVPVMVDQLEFYSKIRRIVRQATKGATYLSGISGKSGRCCPEAQPLKYAWNRHW